jgi:multidrug transporter EmrE-like cation transporter
MNPTALLFLVLAIAAEVAGTPDLKASSGFGRVGPSMFAVLGYALAFYFLAQSLSTFRWESPTPSGRGLARWAQSCWGC